MSSISLLLSLALVIQNGLYIQPETVPPTLIYTAVVHVQWRSYMQIEVCRKHTGFAKAISDIRTRAEYADFATQNGAIATVAMFVYVSLSMHNLYMKLLNKRLFINCKLTPTFQSTMTASCTTQVKSQKVKISFTLDLQESVKRENRKKTNKYINAKEI